MRERQTCYYLIYKSKRILEEKNIGVEATKQKEETMKTLNLKPYTLNSKARGTYIYGQIDLNLEVCRSNSHVHGIVTLAVIVAINSGTSHLHDNHLALVVRRNQRPNDFPNGHF
jgi:hypothetical protein